MTDFLFDGPEGAGVTVLLAHGAGAPMDSAAMTAAARALAAEGLRVARFEFGYMAGRRQGVRKPPPRAEMVMPEYRAAVAELAAPGRLVIGGKSMGGRVASMVADELHGAGSVAGLLCLGYPFHPPGRPEQLRTKHLQALATPALIVQGTRDVFGSREEVAGYSLSPAITRPLARGRRPRPEAAQERVGLRRRRPYGDHGARGGGVGGAAARLI